MQTANSLTKAENRTCFSSDVGIFFTVGLAFSTRQAKAFVQAGVK